jgi:hypothetical protein
MTIKKYVLAVVSVFIILLGVDFFFDSVILRSVSNSLGNVWRPDSERWLEPCLYLASAIIFVYLFNLVYKQTGILESIAIGVLFGLLLSGIQSFKQFALYPIPLMLAVLWSLEGLIQYMLAGVVSALFSKRSTPSSF